MNYLELGLNMTENQEYTFKLASERVDQWFEDHLYEPFTLDSICKDIGAATIEARRQVAKKLSYEIVTKKRVEKNEFKHPSIYRFLNKEKKIIKWDEASERDSVPFNWPKGIDGTTFPFDGHLTVRPTDIIVLAGVSNMGKALVDGTPVLTPDGWVAIESLKVGDAVYNQKGWSITVSGVYPQGVRKCYRLTFNDNTTIDCDLDHLWKVQLPYARTRKVTGHNNPNKNYQQWSVNSLRDIISICGEGVLKPHLRVTIPTTEPVCLPSQDVPLDPYILGLLIGDGCFRKIGVTYSTSDKELINIIKNNGIKTVQESKYTHRLNGINPLMRQLGINGNKSAEKHIPECYLWNDHNVRLGVLQGLMDTDGSVDNNGEYEFCTVSPQLCQDVVFLVRSLGGRVAWRKSDGGYKKNGVKIKCQDRYRLHIKMDICPFRLARKVDKCRIKTKTTHRVLYSIEPVGCHNTTCIRVDDSDGLFITKDFIVTHNSGLCKNLVVENMDDWNGRLTYMVNEYQPARFKRSMRLMDWNTPYNSDESLKFELVQRDCDWEYAIEPDNLNIIDWISMGGDFYKIGNVIKSIQERLHDGVAVIVIQKGEGNALGTGGQFSEHFASYYLSVDFGRIYFKKAKEYHGYNPNGKTYGFELTDGVHLSKISEVVKCTACDGQGVRYQKGVGKASCDDCCGVGWLPLSF